jgi:hypothetical protein
MKAVAFDGQLSESLGEAFPREQARVREVLKRYQEIGPAGFFGATQIELTLATADRAAASGDPVAMLESYKAMRAVED